MPPPAPTQQELYQMARLSSIDEQIDELSQYARRNGLYINQGTLEAIQTQIALETQDPIRDLRARIIEQIQAQEDQEIFRILDDQRNALVVDGPVHITPGPVPLSEVVSVFYENGWHVQATDEMIAQSGALTRENFLEAVRLIDQAPLRPETMYADQQTWDDIRGWLDDPSYVQTPAYPARRDAPVFGAEQQGAWHSHEEVDQMVVNPRAVERLQARRLTVPMFEIASNPTFHMGEIRSRRFSMLDRDQDVTVQRLLDALLRAKRPPPTSPERTPGPSRTIWEALVEIDLVDADPAEAPRHSYLPGPSRDADCG